MLCLDNDGQNPHTETLTHRVAEKLQGLKKTVWVAKPEEVKQDYNDVLIKQGSNAVVKAMIGAIPYETYLEQILSGMTLTSILNTEKSSDPLKASQHPNNLGQLCTQKNSQFEL